MERQRSIGGVFEDVDLRRRHPEARRAEGSFLVGIGIIFAYLICMNYNQTFGSFGERTALSHLQKKGYKILHTNWYCQWGEIDLVAKKGGQLVFFEIKTRRSNVLETMSPGKMKRLSRSVQFYIQRYRHSFENFQVDFIGIERVPRFRLLHLKNILEMRI